MYLDPSGDVPVSRQIVDRLWLEVVTGTLEVGERLPTVRQLAVDLGFRPDTIAHAYQELEALGVLVTRPGKGTFVGLRSPDGSALEQRPQEQRAQLDRLCRDVLEQSAALGLSLEQVIEALEERKRVGPSIDATEDVP
jgi:DNA-binding transcriptional regulator YhcF (GntR family)